MGKKRKNTSFKSLYLKVDSRKKVSFSKKAEIKRTSDKHAKPQRKQTRHGDALTIIFMQVNAFYAM